MERSESIGAIAAALAKAQLKIKNPPLDKVNTFFNNSRYASLGAHIESVRQPLAENGISAVQTVAIDGKMVSVSTTLTHTSGEYMACTASMPLPDKGGVQQAGGIITYLRRYTLASMTLIVGEEDDDGDNDRAEREEREQERKAAAKQKPQPKPSQNMNWLLSSSAKVSAQTAPNGQPYWMVEDGKARFVTNNEILVSDISQFLSEDSDDADRALEVIYQEREGKAGLIVDVKA